MIPVHGLPLSRASYLKQYWPLSETEKPLLQQTQQRLQGLDPWLLLICRRPAIVKQMRQIAVEPNAILLEPMGCNGGDRGALQGTANGETRCCWCWRRIT